MGRWKQYRSTHSLSIVLSILLGVWGILSALDVWVTGSRIELLQQLAAGAQVPEDQLQQNDVLIVLISLVSFVVFVVTAICFLRWTYLVNANAHALGANGMTITPGWAVGWYFIPFLNLYMPFRVMDETFRASHPDYGPNDWRQAPRPAIVPLWWMAWIAGGIVGNIALQLEMSAETEQKKLQAQAGPVQPAKGQLVPPGGGGAPPVGVVPPAGGAAPGGGVPAGGFVPPGAKVGPPPPVAEQQPAIPPQLAEKLLIAAWFGLAVGVLGIVQTYAAMSLVGSLQRLQTAKYQKLLQQSREEGEVYAAELAEPNAETALAAEGIPVIAPVRRGAGDAIAGPSAEAVVGTEAVAGGNVASAGDGVRSGSVAVVGGGPARLNQGGGGLPPDQAALYWLLPVGRSGWAIAAGYLGLFSVLLVPGPLALLCGILAVRDIRRHPGKGGMGRAIFGILMGALATGLISLVVIASIIKG